MTELIAEERRELENMHWITRVLRSESVIVGLVVCVFGGIVWAVQLNVLANQLTEKVSTSLANQVLHTAQYDKLLIQHTRVIAILESMERRTTLVEKVMADHEKESARWKERIIRMQAQRENGTNDRER
jgi:hypothetical protein